MPKQDIKLETLISYLPEDGSLISWDDYKSAVSTVEGSRLLNNATYKSLKASGRVAFFSEMVSATELKLHVRRLQPGDSVNTVVMGDDMAAAVAKNAKAASLSGATKKAVPDAK